MGFFAALLLIVLTAGVLQAAAMCVQAWETRRFLRSRFRAKPACESLPKATLFIPCKGVDTDLPLQVERLFQQDYPQYRLVFIVESPYDPAVAVIDRVRTRQPHIDSRVVVAGRAVHCGQKVHNLRVGVAAITADPDPVPVAPGRIATLGAAVPSATVNNCSEPAREVFVFLDADACARADFLTRMIGRLTSSRARVVTGYRLYRPVSWTGPSLLLSACNNTILALMGCHRHNLVWGGAWATDRDTFAALGLPEAWDGSLSDDLIVSQQTAARDFPVAYEPHCVVDSSADISWFGLWEFMCRQYRILGVYRPRQWWGATAANLVSVAASFAALLALIGLATNSPSPVLSFTQVGFTGSASSFAVAVSLALVLCGLHALRWALFAIGMRHFRAERGARFWSVLALNAFGWPLVNAWHLATLLWSATSRRIVWRGYRYTMFSSHHTQIEIPRSAA